jgi:hypothetical protein
MTSEIQLNAELERLTFINREFSAHLSRILTPFIFQGLDKLYSMAGEMYNKNIRLWDLETQELEEKLQKMKKKVQQSGGNTTTSVKVEKVEKNLRYRKEKGPQSKIKVFQNVLMMVKDWTQDALVRETERLRRATSTTKYFDDLVRATVRSYIMLMVDCRSLSHGGLAPIGPLADYHKRISVETFVHKCYLESSKILYNNPRLMLEEDVPPMLIIENRIRIRNNIGQAIVEAVRRVIPMEMVVSQYLHSNPLDLIPKYSPVINNSAPPQWSSNVPNSGQQGGFGTVRPPAPGSRPITSAVRPVPPMATYVPPMAPPPAMDPINSAIRFTGGQVIQNQPFVPQPYQGMMPIPNATNFEPVEVQTNPMNPANPQLPSTFNPNTELQINTGQGQIHMGHMETINAVTTDKVPGNNTVQMEQPTENKVQPQKHTFQPDVLEPSIQNPTKGPKQVPKNPGYSYIFSAPKPSVEAKRMLDPNNEQGDSSSSSDVESRNHDNESASSRKSNRESIEDMVPPPIAKDYQDGKNGTPEPEERQPVAAVRRKPSNGGGDSGDTSRHRHEVVEMRNLASVVKRPSSMQMTDSNSISFVASRKGNM